MNRLTAILSASIFIFILSGCGSDGASGTDAAQPPPAKTAAQIRAEQYPEGMPAAHSKFAKVKIGMSNQEVMSLIGPPTSQSSAAGVFVGLSGGMGRPHLGGRTARTAPRGRPGLIPKSRL